LVGNNSDVPFAGQGHGQRVCGLQIKFYCVPSSKAILELLPNENYTQ